MSLVTKIYFSSYNELVVFYYQSIIVYDWLIIHSERSNQTENRNQDLQKSLSFENFFLHVYTILKWPGNNFDEMKFHNNFVLGLGSVYPTIKLLCGSGTYDTNNKFCLL